jgi:hypothetical protein
MYVCWYAISLQREGVRFIVKNHGRVLVADEMGLGKVKIKNKNKI